MPRHWPVDRLPRVARRLPDPLPPALESLLVDRLPRALENLSARLPPVLGRLLAQRLLALGRLPVPLPLFGLWLR